MPHFDAAAKSPNRSVQAIKVEETMLPAVNAVLTKNINKAAKPLNVEGYPSLIVVDKKGNAVTSIEAVKSTQVMTNVMNNAGPLAEEAGINVEENIANLTNSSLPNTSNSLLSTQPVINIRSNNVSVEEALVKAPSVKAPSVKAPSVLKPVAIPSATIMPSNNIIKAASAKAANAKATSAKAASAKVEDEAERVVSLSSPLTQPSSPSSDDDSISNSLTAEQKVSGGGYGGSLYSSLLRTTYTLAPAAALLATASIVMKKSKRTKRTKRLNKKSRKTLKMRKN
jgi:hypothetical protein